MKFIHFGCWNKGNCNKETRLNSLSIVMDALHEHIESNVIDFITVAGDNYYPTTDDKTLIDKNHLESGFICLPSRIPKYILYGNHDLINKHDPPPDCKILTLQNEFKSQLNYIFFNDVQTLIKDNTIIIMFDSSLYETVVPNVRTTKKQD